MVEVDGFNELDSLASQLEKPDFNVNQVSVGNFGTINGSGQIRESLLNESSGELRTLAGQTARFGGSLDNRGEVNNFGGVVDVAGAIINTSFIGGRGAFIAGEGHQNSGVMAFTSGNVDVLGDFSNLAGGQVITTGFARTTFFDDVDHNGTEIRTAEGSATVFLGEVTGAGSFSGSGSVFFEGDLRPGNSPAIVEFGGDVFLGTGASMFVELAGSNLGEFDLLSIAGDLELNGSLSVSLLDDFVPLAGSEFLFLNVEGNALGQFTGLDEGDLVGSFGGTDLFISYRAGDGNDVSLFSAVPEPNTVAVFALIGMCVIAKRKRKIEVE